MMIKRKSILQKLKWHRKEQKIISKLHADGFTIDSRWIQFSNDFFDKITAKMNLDLIFVVMNQFFEIENYENPIKKNSHIEICKILRHTDLPYN